MKIINDEERNAHFKFVSRQGLKGCLVGAGAAALLVAGVKRKYPMQYRKFNTSIKAAMWAMPIVSLGAFFADEGSVKFDEQNYRSEYFENVKKDKDQAWNKLSTPDKIFTFANDNKYKIILSAWASAMLGSWTLVNRDKYLTTAQKAVQARVYAQAITVVLLLGTLLLSLHQKKLEESRPKPVPEWKRFLEEQQASTENSSN